MPAVKILFFVYQWIIVVGSCLLIACIANSGEKREQRYVASRSTRATMCLPHRLKARLRSAKYRALL